MENIWHINELELSFLLLEKWSLEKELKMGFQFAGMRVAANPHVCVPGSAANQH